MIFRERWATVIRAVYGIDADALTEDQFERAVVAAAKTERGDELARQLLQKLTLEELQTEIIENCFGIDPARLTPEQKERLLVKARAEHVDERSVPEDEWEAAGEWVVANRDRVRKLLAETPSALPEGDTNLAYDLLHGEGRTGPKAKDIVAKVNALRELLDGDGQG